MVLLFCLFSHRLPPRRLYKSIAKTFFTCVGCKTAPLEVVMIITMSVILGVQKLMWQSRSRLETLTFPDLTCLFFYKNYVRVLVGNSCSQFCEELLSMKVFNM